jgi:hypothetical protein
MLDEEAAKMREAARVACMVAFIFVCGTLSSAQDKPLGDVAREARADKSQAPHATKVVTNEDFGPHLEPVGENEDPAEVVNKARAALLADTAYTRLQETSNNSGPGSSSEGVIEIAGDRAHMTTNRIGGGGPGRDEYIFIGNDSYHRNGNGPWEKFPSQPSRTGPMPIGGIPEALAMSYGSGELELIRRETVNGAPTLLYETKFHPGGVSIRDRTIDIWIGANDHLPRKVQMTDAENEPHLAPIINRETTTWSYGPVPKIEPPM